jgi:hypothetical protein
VAGNLQRIKLGRDRTLDRFRHGVISGNTGGLGMMWIEWCGVNLPVPRVGSRGAALTSWNGEVDRAGPGQALKAAMWIAPCRLNLPAPRMGSRGEGPKSRRGNMNRTYRSRTTSK